jgi:hypothetical protein
MKATVYSALLLVIACLYFACGYSYATGTIPPEYLEVPVPVPVTVEKQWDETLVLGLTPDGHIVENPDSDEGYVYIITLHYMKGEVYNEISVWVPFGEGIMAGVVLNVPSDDYAIDVRSGKVTPVTPEPEVAPDPAEDEEGF